MLANSKHFFCVEAVRLLPHRYSMHYNKEQFYEAPA